MRAQLLGCEAQQSSLFLNHRTDCVVKSGVCLLWLHATTNHPSDNQATNPVAPDGQHSQATNNTPAAAAAEGAPACSCLPPCSSCSSLTPASSSCCRLTSILRLLVVCGSITGRKTTKSHFGASSDARALLGATRLVPGPQHAQANMPQVRSTSVVPPTHIDCQQPTCVR